MGISRFPRYRHQFERGQTPGSLERWFSRSDPETWEGDVLIEKCVSLSLIVCCACKAKLGLNMSLIKFDIKSRFGTAIRSRRKGLGLSQEALAGRAGFIAHIWRILSEALVISRWRIQSKFFLIFQTNTFFVFKFFRSNWKI